MIRTWGGASAVAAAIIMLACVGTAASPVPTAARYNAKGDLLFPADYRSWTYLTSGLGMSYDPAEGAPGEDVLFDNIFADERSHAEFLKTGHWPEGAVLLVERRRSSSKGSINLHGSFQAGDRLVLEAHVHDSKRFKGGWGFFIFEGKQSAKLIDYKANCYSCHQQHAAVDTTFVQFYPTLLPVAAAKKSFSAAYLAEEKARR